MMARSGGRAEGDGRRLVVRSPAVIALALVLIGAVIGYVFAGEAESIIGIKAMGALAGAGVGLLVGLVLSILRGY
jgi:membrane associated rhomboid family serine protease